jgi:hypothetical protein
MEGFALFCGLAAGGFFLLIMIPPLLLGLANDKQKKDKLALMEKHPELAAEIYESMREEEKRLVALGQKYSDDIGTALKPKPKAKPQPGQSVSGALLKAGLGIAAKRLNK